MSPVGEIIPFLKGEASLWAQFPGCGEEMSYLGCHGVGALEQPEGDVTVYYCPTRKANEWEIVRSSQAAPGPASTSLEVPLHVGNVLIGRKCPFSLHLRYSKCEPKDDIDGWELGFYLQEARRTSWSIPAAAALDPDAQDKVMLDIPLSLERAVRYRQMQWVDVEQTETSDQINDIAFCDAPSCIEICGPRTEGCEVGYFVAGGVIYAPAIIGKSIDGGINWSTIATPFTDTTDNIIAVCCYGDLVIVLNGDTGEYAWSSDGGTNWTVVALAAIPADCCMWGGRDLWIVGAGGYIWHSTDGGRTIALQDAGIATGSDLNHCSFASSQVGYAVGDANAIVKTDDGGLTWYALTGPTAGTIWNTVFAIPGTNIIWIGGTEPGGPTAEFWRSTDGGVTWVDQSTKLAGFQEAWVIQDIVFCGCNFGFLVLNEGAAGPYVGLPGRIYRTVDGGYTWDLQTAPASAANQGMNAIFCCDQDKAFIAGDAGLVIRGYPRLT